MPTFEEIGDAVFEKLTADDRFYLARAMRRAAESSERDQRDDFFCALGNLSESVPNGLSDDEDDDEVVALEEVTEEHMLRMCSTMIRAWSSPLAQDTEEERSRLLRGAFGFDQAERIAGLYRNAADLHHATSGPDLFEWCELQEESIGD